VSEAIRFNGEATEPALAFHRGFTYGDGVFRTCLIYESHVIDIERQVDKAVADAKQLGIAGASRELLALEARALAAGQARAVLKILLLRAGGERGYRSSGTQADRLLCRYDAPAFPAAHWEQGVRVARSPFRLAAQPALAGIKHLNRLEQVLAARALPADVAEGLVGDDAGAPLSGTRTNLFWVSAGILRTPSLERCGVAGAMRDKVLESAATSAIPVRIGPGSWEELDGAAEAFVTNSVIGMWPIAGCGATQWRAPGPVTRQLLEHLRHPRLVKR
jgi:4-amino-4-deoxychorismate lyase